MSELETTAEHGKPDKLQGVERYLLRLQANAQGMDASNLNAALDLLRKHREESNAAYLEAVAEAFDHEAQQQATIDTLRKALAVFTHQKHWAHFAADFTSVCCRYCKARGDGVTDVVHADDCPIVVATRQALQESRGQ